MGGIVVVDPEIVKLVGTNAAMVYGQLLYWSKKMGGREFYKSNPDIARETGLSVKMVRRAVEKLMAADLVSATVKGWPRTTFYLVNSTVCPQSALEDTTVGPQGPISRPSGADQSAHMGGSVGPQGPTRSVDYQENKQEITHKKISKEISIVDQAQKGRLGQDREPAQIELEVPVQDDPETLSVPPQSLSEQKPGNRSQSDLKSIEGHYRRCWADQGFKPREGGSKGREKHFRRLLKEHDLQTAKDLVLGHSLDPFFQGQNDRQKRYSVPEFRYFQKHFDHFLDLAQAQQESQRPPVPDPPIDGSEEELKTWIADHWDQMPDQQKEHLDSVFAEKFFQSDRAQVEIDEAERRVRQDRLDYIRNDPFADEGEE